MDASRPDCRQPVDRRQERAWRRREHIAALNQRTAEADLRLKRLYDAVESGVAGLDDPAVKDRIAGLKSTRDQAQADAERAAAALESAGQQTITPATVWKFATTARERIRITGGGYQGRWRPPQARVRPRSAFAVLFRNGVP